MAGWASGPEWNKPPVKILYGVFEANPQGQYPKTSAVKRYATLNMACKEATRLTDYNQREYIALRIREG